MMRVWFVVLCWFSSCALHAQTVLYSPLTATASGARFEVVGKAGNFYWIQKSKKASRPKKQIAPWIENNAFSFEVYDARLNRVAIIPYTISDTVLKQYLLAGASYFDQLLFTRAARKTEVAVNRFAPDGRLVSANTPIYSFPETMQANDFLVVRARDKRTLLLLGFEPVEDAAPRVHALLFDANWRVLFQAVYTNPNFTQPVIQYDFTNYPLEPFDNSPVKLTTTGDWLMLAPARQSNNYILYQFQRVDSSLNQSEIKVSQRAGAQYVSLSVSPNENDVVAGIFFNTGVPAIKKVRTAHYSRAQCRFDFDTAFRFSTATFNKTKEATIFEQYFTPVPGKGFLFIKEYGKPYYAPNPNEAVQLQDAEDTGATAATDPVLAAFNKGDYTRYANLYNARRAYERGDLNLYYFPAAPHDSAWSGTLNKAQTTELNTSYLSYTVVPMPGKIIILYNDNLYNNTRFSSTTILNHNGNAMNDGLVFWRNAAMLDFQKARQIAADELAVPYAGNRGQGFAIIRL